MNTEKVIALDIDGVVLDHVAGFHRWAVRKGIDVAYGPESCDCYNMATMFPGKSLDEIQQLIVDFSVHDEFADVPVVPRFESSLMSLREAFPETRLVAITAPGDSERTKSLRHENLKRFAFDEIHVLGMGASKQAHLSRLPKSAIFFDDLASHVTMAASLGLTSVLFRQPHNANEHHALVADNWDAGLSIVRQRFEGFPCLGAV